MTFELQKKPQFFGFLVVVRDIVGDSDKLS